METPNPIWRAVERVGVPAVLSIALAWVIYQKDLRADVTRETERKEYVAAMVELSKAVNNNTLAVNMLAERMRR